MRIHNMEGAVSSTGGAVFDRLSQNSHSLSPAITWENPSFVVEEERVPEDVVRGENESRLPLPNAQTTSAEEERRKKRRSGRKRSGGG